MPTLTAEVYQSLMDAVMEHCKATSEPLRHFVSRALSDALGLEHSTLFQVSTAGATVQGVYKKAVTVGTLKYHGDFGLGTFEGLDGEMMVLEGHVYQAHPDGSVTTPPDHAGVPFAVVTAFHPRHRAVLADVASFTALTAQLDALRRSDNIFFAVRIDGVFAEMHTRVACKAASGVHLDKATAQQAEFRMTDVTGTLMGFWSPPYSRAISIAGWHLHFLTEDRARGGHVLGCRAAALDVRVQDIDDLHLALPETREFLHADLTQDPSEALNRAELAHDS